jgi:hypothetical protein
VAFCQRGVLTVRLFCAPRKLVRLNAFIQTYTVARSTSVPETTLHTPTPFIWFRSDFLERSFSASLAISALQVGEITSQASFYRCVHAFRFGLSKNPRRGADEPQMVCGMCRIKIFGQILHPSIDVLS